GDRGQAAITVVNISGCIPVPVGVGQHLAGGVVGEVLVVQVGVGPPGDVAVAVQRGGGDLALVVGDLGRLAEGRVVLDRHRAAVGPDDLRDVAPAVVGGASGPVQRVGHGTRPALHVADDGRRLVGRVERVNHVVHAVQGQRG